MRVTGVSYILTIEGNIQVFISYAREDFEAAKKIYADLHKAGFSPWLDKKNLIPGQNWEQEIQDAISESRYFIALFSTTSVKKIGFLHHEFKFALDVFKRYPPGMIFYIPVRLDECEIPYKELKPIHHADLFPDWDDGINGILKAVGALVDIKKHPEVKEPLTQNIEQSDKGTRSKFYNDLCSELKASRRAFEDQIGVRNSLMTLLRQDKRDIIQTILKTNDQYEEIFWETCHHLDDRQRREFNYIRRLTDSLQRHNSAVLKLLDDKNNRLFWKEIPQLEELYYHVDLWIRKYEALKDEKCVALIYVGVREGRPFPTGIDNIVCEKVN
jgi:hypothetical protein